MHFSRLAAAVVSLASAAVTTASPSLPFQDGGALDKRALTPDDIKCHKSCGTCSRLSFSRSWPRSSFEPGNTIQGASKEGYCDDVAWKQLEKKCSECAPKQNNIAAKYHDALKKALEPCGLEVPPVSASAAAQSTSAVSVQPTSAGQESSVARAGPTSKSLGSLVSSSTGAAASTTSASAGGGTRANASTVCL